MATRSSVATPGRDIVVEFLAMKRLGVPVIPNMANLPDLKDLDFGTGASEQERSLNSYFYKSLAFDRACHDTVCLILGPKGSGKSAIFRMMDEGSQGISDFRNPNVFVPAHPELRDYFILLTSKLGPGVDFVTLWKFYFGSIVTFALADTASGEEANFFLDFIKHWGLDPKKFPGGFGATVKLPIKVAELDFGRNPTTRPNPLQIGQLFRSAESLLAERASELWIAVDELDKVAIDGNARKDHSGELLTALMQAHSDLYRLRHIRFKFFMRSDIYEELTYVDKDHFSNAILKLGWRPEDLAIMLAMRISASGGSPNNELTLRDSNDLINSVFEWPRSTPNFEGLLDNLADGNGLVTPRDLLNFAIRARDCQLQFNRYGTNSPKSGLISGAAVDEGLVGASKSKLDDFLTTFPEIYRRLLNLKGHDTAVVPRQELQHLLNIPDDLNFRIAAEEFCRIGALGKEDDKPVHITDNFLVPPIYRRALNLTESIP